MATGTPKKHKPKTSDGAHDSTIALTYSGKAPLDEVLRSQPGTYAECWKSTDTPDNRLFYGENLAVLAHLLKDQTIRGSVRLIYIDPPFATQTVFHSRRLTHAYEDTLAGPEFLEFLRKRLILLRELLADDGSIYLHIDEKMVFPLKVILDEIFGPRSFRNCIARRKCTSKNYTRKAYGKISDYILFYTKTDDYVWNKPLEPWTELRAKEYQYIDEASGRRFMKVPVHAPGIRNGETGKPWRGVSPPPGKHWQFPPAVLDQMDARGEIYWSANGNPRRKIYLDQNPGIGVADLWLDFRDAHNQNIQITGYPTEKNPAILERIVAASSNPGDIVLDCFSGSGTTLAAAEALGRRWIGVDNSEEAIRTTLKRFKHGTEKMGDFVSLRRHTKPNGHSRHEQTSLFSTDELETGSTTHVQKLKLPSFSLIADEALAPKAATILQDWKPPAQTGGIPKPKTGDRFADAIAHLTKSDKILARVIAAIGPCALSPKECRFTTLCESIIGQQLSKGAATSIRNKVRALFHEEQLTAAGFLKLDDEALKEAGLSGRKLAFMRTLAEQVHSGSLRFDHMDTLSDEAIIAQLTQVKGIGRWTAEMFLIFALNRPDVFPLDDVAVQAAMKKLYRLTDATFPKKAIKISDSWRPYRTIACWYLYRFLDSTTRSSDIVLSDTKTEQPKAAPDRPLFVLG